MPRINYTTHTVWETRFGYSRAVKVGNLIEVTGTVAVDEAGQPVGVNDAYTQTCFILEKIKKIVEQAGASLEHVVKTRLYVTDISQAEAFGLAHAAYFAHIKPCMTLIEVKGLISPEYLVEIEATAILD